MSDGNNNYFNNVDNMPEKKVSEKKKSNGTGWFLGGIATGIAVSLFLGAVVYLGVTIQHAVQKNPAKGNQQTVTVVDDDTTTSDSLANAETIAKIAALEKTIDKYFYLDRVDNDTIRNGIYKGLMDSLGDRYTEYYTPEELEELMSDTEGVYYGIGAYVSLDEATNFPKISGVIKNSPAEDSELRANDLIEEVNGENVYGLSLTEVVSLIKGLEGTEVTLTIVREETKERMDITLTRRKVETPTVEYSMEEDNMALIQVTEFDEVTVAQFAEALDDARNDGAKGLILDLRANPGGSLSAVVDMCKMLLPEGLIVYTEDKAGKRTEYKCNGKNRLELPLVVLVDMNSASAAEIMAGAIKDHGIGTLVGTTTFGKGIVQQIVPFRDGSAVKITISAYYTPSGKNIHGIGIAPDVECEFDSEAYYDKENPVDNQLEKAKEVLRGKMNQ